MRRHLAVLVLAFTVLSCSAHDPSPFTMPQEATTKVELGATSETSCGVWAFERVGDRYALTRPWRGHLVGLEENVTVTPAPSGLPPEQDLNRLYELTPSADDVLDHVTVRYYECEISYSPEVESITIPVGSSVEHSFCTPPLDFPVGPFSFERTGDDATTYMLSWPTMRSLPSDPTLMPHPTPDAIEPAPMVVGEHSSPELIRVELRFLPPSVDQVTVYMSGTC